MGHDGEPALLVDLGDGRFDAQVALEPGLQEQSEQMAATSRDLFAYDHVDPASPLAGQALAFDRRLGALVVADRDHVQVGP